MHPYIYGIDFGTTNSALSIIDARTNEIVQTFNEGSLIYFPKPERRREPISHFVGIAAKEKYVESQMTGRFMKSIKRILPRSGFQETRVHGKRYKAENLVAVVLMHLKQKADDFLGMDIKKAVLGRPVIFDENGDKDQLAQDRLLKAAKLSGFEKVYFQMEPIAAAFTYERKITKEETVLVADLGGGTSDFTLMKLGPQKLNNINRKEDIIGQGGIYIGGDNFDSAIMWEKGTPHFGRGLTYLDYNNRLNVPLSFFTNICSWEKMNFFDSIRMQANLKKFLYLTHNNLRFQNLVTLINKNLGYSIFQSIEKAKIELGEREQVSFQFSNSGIDINEDISLAEFSNTIIRDDVEKIKNYLLHFLEKLNVETTDIDTVFMTGGTSMVIPIQEFMKELFGKDAIKSGDNFNSVANGMAYSHVLFFNEK